MHWGTVKTKPMLSDGESSSASSQSCTKHDHVAPGDHSEKDGSNQVDSVWQPHGILLCNQL